MAQDIDVPASPGTVTASIEWLSAKENESICNLDKPFVSEIVIVEILKVGSGLVTPPSEGDTLKIELRRLGNAYPPLNTVGKYVLKENPCFTSNKSYYTIFFKED